MFQHDPNRRARFTRTADILARSGLLDITMRTAELIRKNQHLNTQLIQLRKDADDFVRSVLSNPENKHFAEMHLKRPSTVPSPSLMVSPNLDFSVVDPSGRVTPVATQVLTVESTRKRKKVEVVAEPMAFEDAADMTSLHPKRARIGSGGGGEITLNQIYSSCQIYVCLAAVFFCPIPYLYHYKLFPLSK